jgi:hypothetical protein
MSEQWRLGQASFAVLDGGAGFFVQREVLGLRDRNAIIAAYAIPREVLARLGAI